MMIKRLFVRILIAVILGLCAGIVIELTTSRCFFPVFLHTGILAGVLIGIVIEVIRGALKIKREDLKKMKKPALRILIATSIGLLAGIVLEFAAEWYGFPLFLILGIILGFAAGITIEVIRYVRLKKKAFLDGIQFGLDKLPVDTAEFIKQIIKKMRYRKEVRSEVMAELTAHFEDALKDCKTDEDKRQRAGQLIDDFGDTQLLAILFRRAKIRCRPLWRTMVARSFQALGVLIVCFIFYAVWFSKGQPTISVDYLALFNKMNKPDVRDEDNAWPHYEKALALYIEPDERILKLTTRERNEFEKRLSFNDLDEEKQNKIQKWLKENKSHWDNLEVPQKQLIERCFKEGLVPLPDVSFMVAYIPHSFMERYSLKQYRVFDEAVERIIERIEHPRPDHDRNSRGNYIMDTYRMDVPDVPFYYPLEQRVIKLDQDVALDSEVISSFGTYSQEKLQELKKGIDVGLISRWIDDPPVDSESLFGNLLPFEKKLIVKWVEENESAWEEFRAGSTKTYCYREYEYRGEGQDEFLFNVFYPYLQQIRTFVWVGIWRSRIAEEQGYLQQSIDDCLAIARAGNHWQNNGMIIDQLVGLAFRNLAYRELSSVLTVQKLSAVELKDLQHQLSQFYPNGYLHIDLEGERMAFMDAVQRLFTDGGPGGGHLIPQKTEMIVDMYDEIVEIAEDVPVGRKFIENATLTSMCLLHARRDLTVKLGEQMYDKQAEIVRLNPYQRHKHDLIDFEEMLDSIPRFRYALLYYFMPMAERISERSYQGKALHEAIITIAAIQRWRLEKDDYPANLDELVEGGFLKELPMDPYSDKSLIYKKTEDNFVLYSVGCNFKDDGGEVFKIEDHRGVEKWGTSRKGDAVFWPLSED